MRSRTKEVKNDYKAMSHSNYKIIYNSHSGIIHQFTYLTIHLPIYILALDITSLVFNTFPASCAEVYTKWQYSLSNIVVVVVCYFVAKIHFTPYSECIYLCRLAAHHLHGTDTSLLMVSLLMLGLNEMQESHY